MLSQGPVKSTVPWQLQMSWAFLKFGSQQRHREFPQQKRALWFIRQTSPLPKWRMALLHPCHAPTPGQWKALSCGPGPSLSSLWIENIVIRYSQMESQTALHSPSEEKNLGLQQTLLKALRGGIRGGVTISNAQGESQGESSDSWAQRQ